jgi:hypothetical protein
VLQEGGDPVGVQLASEPGQGAGRRRGLQNTGGRLAGLLPFVPVSHLLEELVDLGRPRSRQGRDEVRKVLVPPVYEAPQDSPRKAALDLVPESAHHVGRTGEVLAPELLEAPAGGPERRLSREGVVDERLPGTGAALAGQGSGEAVQGGDSVLLILRLEVAPQQVRFPPLQQRHQGPGRAGVVQEAEVGERLLDEEDGHAGAGEAGDHLDLRLDLLAGRGRDEP